MDYKRIYYSIVERARGRVLVEYSEKHHIVPRCLGGTDEEENLVRLTPREHFLCHCLLIRIHPGNAKLIYAAKMMANMAGKLNRNYKVSSRLYEDLKILISKAASEAMKGKPKSAETKKKLSEANKGKSGRVVSEETKKKLSEARKRRKVYNMSEENKAKLLKANLGRTMSEESKRKRLETRKRNKN
jgi:hypothetical protein